MSAAEGWSQELSFPALLRAARRRYAVVIRAALAAEGYDDVPRNGSYVISGLARTRAPLADIIAQLGVSKQSAGQLVDTLVLRGYVDRQVDDADRRRLTVSLTERGRVVAGLIRAAVDDVDEDLARRVGPESVAAARRALQALAEVPLDK